MLDPKLIREEPEKVKENLARRQDPDLLSMVDEFVSIDQEWRHTKRKIDDLRQNRNQFAKKIGKSEGSEKEKLIERMATIKAELEDHEGKYKTSDSRRTWILNRLPNLLHESVPYGVDDNENVEIRTYGEKPSFDFEHRDHHELLSILNLADIERARKTSGARFYFLKNQAVILEMALMRYGMDLLLDHGIELLSTPSMVRKEMLYGTGFLPLGEEDIFRIEGEDLNLIGTSEVTLGGMHQNEVFTSEELPVRYAGYSSCYRTEASATTKDDKGIFRVHEFKKVEQFTFCEPENSWAEQERMIGLAEKVFQNLDLHYRVVNICTGDLGGVAARKFDIEVWMPGQQRYREVVSNSNCTDYQARRLNIRYREKKGSPVIGNVHTLNSTTITNTRPIIAILENNQQEDGSVLIPKVLQKYTGFDKISPTRV